MHAWYVHTHTPIDTCVHEQDVYVKWFKCNRQMHTAKLSTWLIPASDTLFRRLFFVRNNFPKHADYQHATHQISTCMVSLSALIRDKTHTFHEMPTFTLAGQLDSWRLCHLWIAINQAQIVELVEGVMTNWWHSFDLLPSKQIWAMSQTRSKKLLLEKARRRKHSPNTQCIFDLLTNLGSL